MTDSEQETRSLDLPALLRRPDSYAHRPETVDFLQTHISWLFFAGDRVYKVKKPVGPPDIGFLDYTTLANRKHFCEEEVRLNRRLAPQTYFGVARILQFDSEEPLVAIESVDRGVPARFDAESSRVIDYAVEMQRLPADRMMTELLRRGEIDNDILNAIAELLISFHSRCQTGPGVDEHASPDSLREQFTENLDQLEKSMRNPSLGDHSQVRLRPGFGILAPLRTWGTEFIGHNESLFIERMRGSRIRDGHGDIHAGNICILDHDEIVIYDCIEFTPRFRCRDVACELAFLAMDLDARRFRGFARYLLHRYAELANDKAMLRLADFYKVHLAVVRAKVAAICAEETDGQERQEAVLEALRYLNLAATYVLGPVLIVMCGLPASGKSFAAASLAQPFEAGVLRTDAIRKQLAGIEPTDPVPQARRDEVYSEAFTQRTYERLIEAARQALAQNRSVVADGMFPSPESRRKILKVGQEAGVPSLVVHVFADDEVVRKRMNRRAGDRAEISDADWEVYVHAKSRFRPPEELPGERVVSINSSQPELQVKETITARVLYALLHARQHDIDVT